MNAKEERKGMIVGKFMIHKSKYYVLHIEDVIQVNNLEGIGWKFIIWNFASSGIKNNEEEVINLHT